MICFTEFDAADAASTASSLKKSAESKIDASGLV